MCLTTAERYPGFAAQAHCPVFQSLLPVSRSRIPVPDPLTIPRKPLPIPQVILLYGANGYTGRLIAEEFVRRGVRPILAGRNAGVVAAMAARHGLDHRAFGLDDSEGIACSLGGVTVVLHAAGPFFRTSAPMVAACLACGVHYLDITGEISVFEACRARDEEARRAGVILLPGTGFDVVPTDCLAARLAERMPDASLLELAFSGGGSFSRGTLKTMVLGLDKGGAIRREGRIESVPLGWKRMLVPFRDRTRLAVTIPWGDVSTAHWSTRIPNIHTYMAPGRNALRLLGVLGSMRKLLRFRPLASMVERLIDRTVDGPGEAVRSTAKTQVWGRVTRRGGESMEATAVTPEAYRLTAISSVECALRVLNSPPPTPGYHTPSSAFGPGFLESLPECEVRIGV